MVAILGFPDPGKVKPCPKDCGVPVNEAKTPTGSQVVHTGTWQEKCTPKQRGKS